MSLPLFFLAFTSATFFFTSSVSSQTIHRKPQNFIIRVQNDLKPTQFSTNEEWYSSILNTIPAKNSTTTNILHVYDTVFHGFCAPLTRLQIRVLKTRPEILSVFQDRIRKIQTTRTPHFLGLEATGAISGLMNESDYGSDVIIGVLDTGISPEHCSFSDEDMDPVPARWKGECKGGANFPKKLCNKKLIGVRYFHSEEINAESKSNESARDTIGHGTHTASTAAGRAVKNASTLGFASGEAVGIAPKARIAVYKVCWDMGCAESDILAGLDSAVKDGVDIISMSIGSYPLQYWEDVIAIGAFEAMKKGVFVSASAGNDGPYPNTVSNLAPWITTVGASTLDRTFNAVLELGDGSVIVGSSLYGPGFFEYYPVIYAGNASFLSKPTCKPGSLNPELVRGKIVVCDAGEVTAVKMGMVVRDAGGVGVVVPDPLGEDLLARPHMIPGIAITSSAGKKLFDYLTSDPNPEAAMSFQGTQIGVKPAPIVASFSSRGPNTVSMNILKPDIIAPGVNILAAWPNDVSPSGLTEDPRRTEFNILSGTSMSCPHVSGIAALLKGAHPDWSPAAIKSALVTTSYSHYPGDGKLLFDSKGVNSKGDPWSMGAGHVDPLKAVDPGLIYNISANDYVDFLCASGYTSKQLKAVTGRATKCLAKKKLHPWDLNYPAISVTFNASAPSDSEVLVKRTVTYVGNGNSAYGLMVSGPDGVSITVDRDRLIFTKKGEQKSFTVKISAGSVEVPAGSTKSMFGALIFTFPDGSPVVTSPIVLTWIN